MQSFLAQQIRDHTGSPGLSFFSNGLALGRALARHTLTSHDYHLSEADWSVRTVTSPAYLKWVENKEAPRPIDTGGREHKRAPSLSSLSYQLKAVIVTDRTQNAVRDQSYTEFPPCAPNPTPPRGGLHHTLVSIITCSLELSIPMGSSDGVS